MVETFLGGFAGGFLEVGHHIGYGVYFSTARILGVPVPPGGGALAGMMAGFIKGELMPRLTAEESAQTLAMLDGMKDFEIGRDRIRAVELRRPGLGVGTMTIVPADGAPIVVKLRHRTAYDRLVQLLQAFAPELVRLA